MAWTTPGTATAGEVLTAAFWNEQVRDQFTELAPFFGAWTDYTPSFTNLTVGNGTLTAKYLRIGDNVWVRVYFVWGSTTSATSSSTAFSVPFTATSPLQLFSGSASLDDAGTRRYTCTTFFISNTACRIAHSESGNLGQINNANPFTWTTGDSFSAEIFYEAE